MSDEGGLGGFSLLELFKAEAETHCAALSEGLLSLERSPGNGAAVEPLMRAAHSLKGAARIVGLDAIVPLAHAMEDCFESARRGAALGRARIDLLLRCVDVLAELRSIDDASLPGWTEAHRHELQSLADSLRAPADPDTDPVQHPPAVEPAAPSLAHPSPDPDMPTPPPAPVAPAATTGGAGVVNRPAATEAAKSAAAVRVSALTMNHLLALSAESAVEAGRAGRLRDDLRRLKSGGRSLESAAAELCDVAAQVAISEDVSRRLAGASAALQAATKEMQRAVADHDTRIEETLRRFEELTGGMHSEVMRSRLRPFSEAVTGFPRMVRDIANELSKQVSLVVHGGEVQVDRDVLQKLDAPLTHLVRNAVDHGIESASERTASGKPPEATIHVSARHEGGMLLIEVRDDGKGIDPEMIRKKVVDRAMVDATTAERLSKDELLEMLFLPGFSTRDSVTQISGRGVGLNIVQAMVQETGGIVRLASEPGRGARFSLRLPVTRSVARSVLARSAGVCIAFPLAGLERVARLSEVAAAHVQGRACAIIDDEQIGLLDLADILGLEAGSTVAQAQHAIILGARGSRCGLVVDEIAGEEELVVRPLDPRLGPVPHVSGAAIRSDGEPVLVIDQDDVMRTVRRALSEGVPLGVARGRPAGRAVKPSVLVVDDSISVREVERQVLARAGYEVQTAVDGKDGLNTLKSGEFDLLVTDVDMPRMTGIELARAVRADPRLARLPIIMVSYKDREEDRLRGLEAGANVYLTKSSFQDESFLRAVRDLIGAKA